MEKTIKNFLDTNSGRRLMENHSLTESGVWAVLGEDPNCDFGGSHYNPTLGYYTGTLQKVLEVAVNLDNFWTWGAGGEIKKIDIINL